MSPTKETIVEAIRAEFAKRDHVIEEAFARLGVIIKLNGGGEAPKPASSNRWEEIKLPEWRTWDWKRSAKETIVPNQMSYKINGGNVTHVTATVSRGTEDNNYSVNQSTLEFLRSNPKAKAAICRVRFVTLDENREVKSIDNEFTVDTLWNNLHTHPTNNTKIEGGGPYWYVNEDGKFEPFNRDHYRKDHL